MASDAETFDLMTNESFQAVLDNLKGFVEASPVGELEMALLVRHPHEGGFEVVQSSRADLPRVIDQIEKADASVGKELRNFLASQLPPAIPVLLVWLYASGQVRQVITAKVLYSGPHAISRPLSRGGQA